MREAQESRRLRLREEERESERWRSRAELRSEMASEEMMDLAQVKKLKVAELRAELKKRGLDTSGLKAVLAKRLSDHIEASEAREKEEAPAPEAPAPESADDPKPVDEAKKGAEKRAREEAEDGQPSKRERGNAEEVREEEEEKAPSQQMVIATNKRQKTLADEYKASSMSVVRVDANGVRRLSSLDAPIMLCEGHAAEIFAMKFSPDGSCFATGSMDKEVFLWNVAGECENFAVLKGHKNAVLDLHWTSDGNYLCTASPDKTVRVWDAWQCVQVKKWDEHEGFVNSCCPARRGNPQLFLSGSDDGSAKIWDQRWKRSVHTCQEKYQITSVCFSDQADLIFTAGIDNVVRVRDCRTYKVLYTLSGHADSVTGLSLSHDGSYLLSNSMDQTLRMWDVRPFAPEERCVRILGGHCHNFEQNLLKCAWSMDDQRVTCGSADGLVNIWDVSNGGSNLVYKLPGHQGSVNEAVFHPREKIIGSCSSDKKVFLGEVDI